MSTLKQAKGRCGGDVFLTTLHSTQRAGTALQPGQRSAVGHAVTLLTAPTVTGALSDPRSGLVTTGSNITATTQAF